MLAASVWSLIIPAIEMSSGEGIGKILQTASGFLLGIISMILTDKLINNMSYRCNKYTNYGTKTLMQYIAVTVHNVPEGMAVGMVFASILAQSERADFAPAFILAFGIAMQNIPEGAIVIMPMLTENLSRKKTLLFGFISGVVEPLGAVVAILASRLMAVTLPLFLSFAAGAMMYVVVEQLIPDMYEGEKKKGRITLILSLGFLLMMSLDVIFG